MAGSARSKKAGLELRDWTIIGECLEDASSARNLREFYTRTIAGAERLIPCDFGAACFRFEHGLPRWTKGCPDGFGEAFNTTYRYKFPIPIKAFDRSIVFNVFPWPGSEKTEYVQDYFYRYKVGTCLGAVSGTLNISILRGRCHAAFTLREALCLTKLRKELEGVHAWIRRAEEELLRPGGQDLGGRLPRLLSPREAEVAFEASHGLSAREISLTLDISPRTAERHLANVYDKLGIGSRDELRRFLQEPESIREPEISTRDDMTYRSACERPIEKRLLLKRPPSQRWDY